VTAELERLRKKIKTLEGELRKRDQQRLSFKEVREEIFKLSAFPISPPREWTQPPVKGKGFAGIPTLALGDWHYGETVEAKEAYGNRFHRRVAASRARRAVMNAADLIAHHMTGERAKTMVVVLLGDMISGEIHDELKVTNDGPLVSWIPELVEILFSCLCFLIETLDVNLIVPCVAGNHGRNTHKVQAKRFGPSNFDWLTYTLLERELGKSVHKDKVRFIVHPSNEARWDLFGHRYLALHGHDLGVRGGDGIIGALGPIMRGRLKVLAQQRAAGYEVNTLVIGHWHQYITVPGLIVNGTLKGYDEFAARVLRAPLTPPTQALWYTHPKYGITCHWPIFVE